MTLTEILTEMEQLSPEELKLIQEKLASLGEDFSETPEMRAAIDEGLRSLRDEPTITIEELEQRVASWRTKSS